MRLDQPLIGLSLLVQNQSQSPRPEHGSVSESFAPDTSSVGLSTANDFETYPGVRDGVRQILTSAAEFETAAVEFETRLTCHMPPVC